jgi:predicted SAM-dependent methyltransferase
MDFRSDIPVVFSDWYRVLRAGGIARIIVPDARRFLEAYLSGNPELWRNLGWDINALPHDIYTPMHVINHIFHQSGEHLFAYDFETLAWALHRAGFAKVQQMSFRKSRDPELAIDQPNHAPYSLYVEAAK